MALTYYLANKLLDHVLRNTAYTSPTTVYLALFTVMPNASGGGTEVTGGSYARQALTVVAAANGVSSNATAVEFSSMPGAVVIGAGVFDALTSGNLLTFGRLSTSVTIPAGADYSVPVGDVVGVLR